MSIRRSGSNSQPGRRSFWNPTALALAITVVLAACSGDDPTAPIASETTIVEPSISTTAPTGTTAKPTTSTTSIAPTVVPAAVWSSCGGGLQCATVSVPLDHDQPTNTMIELALVRVPSSGSARGSIFVNPGGPGGTGVRMVQNGFRLDETTMANYHLVGFDPRGIGESTPVLCQTDLTDGPRPDLSPDSPAEVGALNDVAQQLAEQCQKQSGELLPHLGTDSVIADLDLLRQAVGDDQLHYYGFSYGTLIGLRYADRYPENVGHLVLDGVVDPSFTLPDLLRQQALAFEAAFIDLDSICGTVLDCPAGGITAAYDEVSRQLEASGPQGSVGNAELDFASLVALYSESLWPSYAVALQRALGGDYSGIERLHDAYAGVTNFAAYAAVSCYDSPSPRGADGWDAFALELQEIAPRFGFALANELRTCAYWGDETGPAPGPVTAEGANPMLVLTTTGDVATPVENARTVAANLTGAGLVVAEGGDHTAYGSHPCVHRYVQEYFVNDLVPEEPILC